MSNQTVDPALSEKRRRAGRRGAAARWGTDSTDASDRPWKTARPVAKLRQGRNDWYKIENRSADATDIYIYDEIGYFGVTARDFVLDLADVTTDTIQLHLNSPGGDVFDGVAIYNALRDHRADVEVIVDGLAASAASFIAMAGDRIVMTKNATMMIHDAHGLAIGNSAEMRDLAELLDTQSNNIASIYADRAGGTIENWRAAMRTESWYNADEAVAAGLADEIKGRSESKNSFDLSIYSYAGRQAAPAPYVPGPVVAPGPVPGIAGLVGDHQIDLNQLQIALRGAFA